MSPRDRLGAFLMREQIQDPEPREICPRQAPSRAISTALYPGDLPFNGRRAVRVLELTALLWRQKHCHTPQN